MFMGESNKPLLDSIPDTNTNKSVRIQGVTSSVRDLLIGIFNASLQSGKKSFPFSFQNHNGQEMILTIPNGLISKPFGESKNLIKSKAHKIFDGFDVSEKKRMKKMFNSLSKEYSDIKSPEEFKGLLESGKVGEDIILCLLVLHLIGGQGQEGLSSTIDNLQNSRHAFMGLRNSAATKALMTILDVAERNIPLAYNENEEVIPLFHDYIREFARFILSREFSIDFHGNFDTFLSKKSTGAANTRDAQERKAQA